MRNRGFTLIELCVTIAIAGLIISVGVVQFRQWSANQQVVAAADQIALMFKRAGQLSSTTGSAPVFAKGVGTDVPAPPTQTGIQVELTRNNKVLETIRADGVRTRVEGFPESGGFVHIEQGVALAFKEIRTDGDKAMMAIIYGANGMPLETGSITVYNTKVARVVRVQPGGMVKVEDATPP